MNKAASILSVVSICLAAAVVYVGIQLSGGPAGKPVRSAAWTAQDQRSLAGKLKAAGLTEQAIAAYTEYIRMGGSERTQSANLFYSLGKMAMEAGRYEEALGWLYRVEIADPATSLKAEVGSKIINCLERSGKHNAAEYALGKRTSRGADAQKTGSTVVAEVAGEKIYLEDINEALDALPEWMRTQFDSREKRGEFLKKHVADELFMRKALKLELDKDPAVRKQLKRVERDLLVNKVVESELKDKIKIEPDDLKNYFEVRRDQYKQKEAVKVSLIKAGMHEIAEKISERLRAGEDFYALATEVSLDKATAPNGGRFGSWVRKGEDDLGIGNVAEVSRVLFSTAQGVVTEPVTSGDDVYVFKIESTRPEKMPEFSAVREQVQNDYYRQKLTVAYQALLEQILKSSEVKLYPEAMTKLN
ncbi:MAG: hypothetical protein GY868_07075 [Deltaproteobacteria bacterium]|nr:hypothetical protein [Deltaproteobacteria bacterium]